MSSDYPCVCGRPVLDNATICRTCGDHLAQALGDVPALVEELETTRLRQSRIGSGQAAAGAERPLPWDQRASEVLDDLRSTLVAWTRVIIEEHPGQGGGPACAHPCRHESCWTLSRLTPPGNTLPLIAAFLLGQVPWIRHQPWAADVLDEIPHAVGRITHVIDRRPEMYYRGPCGEPQPDGTVCPEDLYASRTATSVTCRACQSTYDTAERVTWLLAVAEDMTATPTELSAAVTDLGHAVPAATIRSWVTRGRLVERSVDSQGRPVYRVGDVLDLLAAEAARRASNEARAAEKKTRRVIKNVA